MNITEFFEFSESLKLNQKAELFDKKEKNIISEVYTDLFPNNAVNDKVNLPNTTVIIGRKGTGKSTIFQKSIQDQINKNNVFPIYIDVKTIFDRATPTLNYENASYISKSEVMKYLLYKNFLKEVCLEIKKKAESHLNFNFFQKAIGLSTEKIYNIQEQLNKIENELNKVFEQIDINLYKAIGTELENTSSDNFSINGVLGSEPK